MPLIVIGLGNPGDQYRHNRHNVGFHVIDGLASCLKIKLKKVFLKPYLIGCHKFENDNIFLVKPLTFMNLSGIIIPHLLKKSKGDPADIVVVCDNLDIPPGKLRLKKKGSSGGQRGLQSIIDTLGSNEFKRLFVGIGRPLPGEEVIAHVLGNPEGEEKGALALAVSKAVDHLPLLLTDSVDSVIARLN